jgi:hypothetical protein
MMLCFEFKTCMKTEIRLFLIYYLNKFLIAGDLVKKMIMTSKYLNDYYDYYDYYNYYNYYDYYDF